MNSLYAVVKDFGDAHERVDDDWIVDVRRKLHLVVAAEGLVLRHDVLADLEFHGFFLKEIDGWEEVFLLRHRVSESEIDNCDFSTYHSHETFEVLNVCHNFIDESLQLRIKPLKSSLLCDSHENVAEELVDNVRVEVSRDILSPKLDARNVIADIRYRVNCLPRFVEDHQALVEWRRKQAEDVAKLSE